MANLPPIKPAYIGLAGPTASGKTAAALLLAQHIPVEIISVDSALVYRGMDIGTAKPTPAERSAVPHHLIDIIDPAHSYSAAQFVQDATRLIADIQSRGRLPLLVGGTMLYFKALFHGLDAMPPADAAVRAQIDREAQAQGWPALHAQLAQVDAITAARLSPNDSQRIQRALEVYRSTGKPLSAHHLMAQAATKNVATTNTPVHAPLISLEPTDRAWLHARIAQRLQTMLQTGLVAEVQALRARGDLHPDLPSMRCVGYRQTWEMLDGAFPQAELQDRCIFATRQLAKRQITWLRSSPERHVVPCDQPQAAQNVLDLVQSWL
ncbi:MAG: tRNA (adenosine(37)-N6)-dimethylallyltransferase MiaA [Burkholderiaceae bacterium]